MTTMTTTEAPFLLKKASHKLYYGVVPFFSITWTAAWGTHDTERWKRGSGGFRKHDPVCRSIVWMAVGSRRYAPSLEPGGCCGTKGSPGMYDPVTSAYFFCWDPSWPMFWPCLKQLLVVEFVHSLPMSERSTAAFRIWVKLKQWRRGQEDLSNWPCVRVWEFCQLGRFLSFDEPS